jgi:hypothetical protein
MTRCRWRRRNRLVAEQAERGEAGEITAVKTSPLVRAWYVRPISSMAKTIPASGVLKAAATPAAEPARIRPLACAMPPHRASCSITDAPTWTVGPSRLMEAPHISPSRVSPILPITSFSESRRLRSSSSRECRAAIACGMPLKPRLSRIAPGGRTTWRPGMTLRQSCAMRRAFRNIAAEIGRKPLILGQP